MKGMENSGKLEKRRYNERIWEERERREDRK